MNLVIAISQVSDGDMKINGPGAKDQIITNRTNFLAKNGIKLSDSTLVKITYDGTDYTRYREVDESRKGQGMRINDSLPADGLVTRELGHALFLPLADCVGAVIHDPTKGILMVSHLGRHSVEQNGGYESIRFLVDNYGCKPENLAVWLTPAPGRQSYPVHAMGNRGLKELAIKQLESAGVQLANITDSPIDTATDKNYFSHSEFLKGNRPNDGRYAIVAMMRDS